MLPFPDRNFRAPTQYNSASPDVDTSSLVKTVRKHSGESTQGSDNNISIGDTQNGTKLKRSRGNHPMLADYSLVSEQLDWQTKKTD